MKTKSPVKPLRRLGRGYWKTHYKVKGKLLNTSTSKEE